MLVIFDVCDTLYAANTTFGFLEHYEAVRCNKRLARARRRWSSRSSPFFYLGALAYRLSGRDLPRTRMIAALAGERRADLAAAAADYARGPLAGLANRPLHDLLDGHALAGDEIVLVSSSLDLVVAPIAAALGVGFRASELEFEGDVCTGRIAKDLTGRKAEVVRQISGGRDIRIKVYTDNRSDLDVIALADEAAIVVPSGRQMPRWGVPNCDYVRL